MTNKNITINGVEYTPAKTEGEQLSLVLCDNRGLLMLGLVDWESCHHNGGAIKIRDAQCVIYWGTDHTGKGTGHVAQLANNGPTSKTKLAAKADFYLNKSSYCGHWLTSAEVWK